MLKNFMQILVKNMAIFSFMFFSHSAFSQDYSNSEIIRDIEKTFVFDKESREQIDVYRNEKSVRKSDFTIKSGEKTAEKSQEKASVEIFISNPKAENFDIREKEKLAYNSALIGQDEVAMELYKQVIAVEPENNYSKFSLAVIYQKLGQFRQAKNLYHELLKSDQANKEEIVGNLISILIDESPREAVYMLSRLSIQNSQSPEIFAKLAIAYDKVKDFDNAINAIKTAIVLSPQTIEYKYNLAVIFDKTAQSQQALELYLEVAKNYSNDAKSVSLAQVQKRIESLQNNI